MSPLLASTSSVVNADDPINVSQTVAFGIIAALMIFAALRVVTTRNVVHAAMWLVVVLAGAAAQYILLAAEFVAVTQVMVYIGAVVVLFLFGVMLTRPKLGADTALTRSSWVGAAFVGVALMALLTFSVVDTFEDSRIPEERRQGLVAVPAADATEDEFAEAAEADPSVGSNTAAISDSLFSRYVIQLEVMGVLLTAALVGAIAIAKRD